MKVNLNGKEVTIGWKYHNPILRQMLESVGVSETESKSMTQPEIANAVGIRMNDLPKPNSVTCQVTNEDREIIMQSTVKRYFKDTFSKEVGRQESLKKLLDTYFAGKENKQTRRAFWEKYVSCTVLEKKYTKDVKLYNRLCAKFEKYADTYNEVKQVSPVVH